MPLTLDKTFPADQLLKLSKRDLLPVLEELTEAVQPGSKIVAELRRAQDPLVESFRKELARVFKELGKRVATATLSQGGLLFESKRERDARVQAIINAANLEAWEDGQLRPIYDYQYNKIAEATFKLLKKMGLKVSLREKFAKKILKTGGKRMGLLDIKGDVKKALFQVIEEGRAKGMNPRQTAKLIEKLVPRGRYTHAGSKYRSQLIARTETLHAQRISTIEGYRSTNYIERVVALDGDSDDECAARNGETFALDEAEVEASLTHPNCVLAFAPAGT